MTRTEHLERIKRRCEELIRSYQDFDSRGSQVAGWKSTIAAIETLNKITMLSKQNWEQLADQIISAWPESLL